jgi:acetylornithine deacetylase/succinyl-diaminopimelate desuccinylase-like protein
MTLKALLLAAPVALSVLAPPVAASAQQLRPDQAAFRALYKELVETNTSLSAGSCTLAAQRMAAHLKAAGFKDSEITLFADPAFPKEGGMVAVLPGSDPKAKPILLLAHLDVVEAKREDWTRDPFEFIEENGFFYGRGVADDKAQAAIWTDTLVRYRKAGKVPKRTLKLALTCGEETTYAFNGADWLAKNRPELIAAEYAHNEGGGGRLDASGKPMAIAVQVGEKTVQNYQIEATNPGGHSSVPRRDNAATDLAAAIININTYDFPTQLNPTTTSFFSAMSNVAPAPMGPALKAIVANPADPAANAIANKDPMFHSMLRTTCVVTQISAGHANNALAQRATANVNCRLFPGTDPEAVRAELAKVIGNPAVKVTLTPPVRPIAKSPPMDPAIIGPMKTLGEKYFPGVPMLATMSTGATDSIFLSPIGIPTYGVPGIFGDPDGNGAHGLNERLRVKSVYDGRDYLYELVGILAD